MGTDTRRRREPLRVAATDVAAEPAFSPIEAPVPTATLPPPLPPQAPTPPGPGWWLASDGQWYPPHPAVATQVVSRDSRPISTVTHRNLSLGGGGALVLGALLPWVTGPFGISKSGIEGDGVLTLLLGIIILVLARKDGPKRASLWLAIVAALIAAYDIVDILSTALVSVGIGLVITAGGAAAVIAAWVKDRNQSGSSVPPTPL